MKYAASLGIAVGCYICARRRGAGVVLFALAVPLMLPLVTVGFTTIRAQLFTLLHLVVLLLLLEVDSRGKKWWLLIWLPQYVLWLNMQVT